MKKVREIHLKHLLDELDGLESPAKMINHPVFVERETWIKFKICCHFQAIEPMDALRNYIRSAAPDQIVHYVKKQVGGKKR